MAHIVKWRESAAIADLAHLIAVTRPGYALTAERKREIEDEGSFDVSYLEVTALAISSSDLRARLREGRSIRYLTMQSVRDYILEHGLYGEADDAAERAEEVPATGADDAGDAPGRSPRAAATSGLTGAGKEALR